MYMYMFVYSYIHVYKYLFKKILLAYSILNFLLLVFVIISLKIIYFIRNVEC